MSKRSVAAALLGLALSGLALSGLAGPALAACKVSRIVDLPVTMSGLRPMVPAKINGVDVMFVADSGAFYSMITPSTAAELKLSLEPAPWNFTLTGVGGEARASLTVVKTFTLAAVPIHNVEFIVASGVDNDAAGLLGQNVLGLADVEYDLANGAIRLMRPDGCPHTALAYWAGGKGYSVMGIQAPEQRNPHTLGVAYVNGARILVMFDTGASTSVMTLRAAARAGVKPSDADVLPAGLSYGIGRHPVKTWITPVASFRIGDEDVRNTRLRIADMDLEGADMLLGADFFLSHRVYVSNSQHKLYFTYNGGPVFNLTAAALVQDAPDHPPRPSAPPSDVVAEPGDAEGFSRRGAALAARRDFDRAIADFTRASALSPSEPKYVYQRAMVRLSNQQPFLAMADLDQTLKLKPDDIAALVARAELRLAGHDKAAASLDLDAAARLAPREADVRLRLAGLYQRVDQFDLAIAQYDLWIAAHADDGQLVQALNGRCWTRALAGRALDQALNDCNRAVRGSPKTPAVLDSRGLVYLRQGQLEKAIADYDAALALQPNSAWSLYGRGLARLRLGQKADGQADMAAATALRPKLPEEAKGYGIAASDGE